MPTPLWLLLVVVILVLVAHYIGEGLVRMLFYVLALIVAVFAVWQLVH